MAANEDVMMKNSMSGESKAASRFLEPRALGRMTRFRVFRSICEKTRSSRTMAPLTMPATGGMVCSRFLLKARTASRLVTSSDSIWMFAPASLSSSLHKGVLLGLRLTRTMLRAPCRMKSRHRLCPRSRVRPTRRYVLYGRRSCSSTRGLVMLETILSFFQSRIWNGSVSSGLWSSSGAESSGGTTAS